MEMRKKIPLSELCLLITDGSHYSPKEEKNGIPMFSVKDMGENSFNTASAKRISEDDFQKLKRNGCEPKLDDVVIAKDGSVLKHVFRVSIDEKCALLSSIAILRPNPEIVDGEFLAYSLKNPFVQADVLANYVSGSGVPRIVLKDFKRIPLTVPDLRTQKTIAAVLHNIDRKISINLQISASLEQIAQSIFKSWFVDFDPVKAKMAGEKPVGIDNATAALFPDSMEDSELGPIPKGWECKTADNIFSVGIGRTPPRKEPEWFCKGGDGVDWVSIRDMGSYGVFSSGTSEGLTEEAVKKFRVPIVPKGTVLMSFKLTVGKLCITDRDLVTNEAIAHFKQNESSPISSLFAYLWLSNHDMESLDSTSSIGTATNSGFVKAIRFLIPSAHTISHFESLASPLFNQIESLTAQSRKLVELRDSLLPRLISGELRIPDEMLVS